MEQPFHMFELTRVMVEEIRSRPGNPHRHEYEELLIITKGEPENMIDFFTEKVKAPVVIYVAQGKVHEFVPDPQTRGWCIRYRNDFIPESNFHFYSSYLDRITFPFDPGACRQQIGILCELILFEYQQKPEAASIYRHLFNALLAKLEAEGEHHLPVECENKSPRQIAFQSFLTILENNFTRDEGVGFYADKMNTSVRNLNILCTKVFGKSVSEIIETRKLIEARRLLLGTEMTVSEVGFSLGYNEKSYFSRVFRKKTGLTPTEFRTTVQS
jgi:AraC family transcriptional regulator, transcriptional activator of pobA